VKTGDIFAYANVNLMSDLWLSGLKKTIADAESTSNY
jgi:hypothetical protein